MNVLNPKFLRFLFHTWLDFMSLSLFSMRLSGGMGLSLGLWALKMHFYCLITYGFVYTLIILPSFDYLKVCFFLNMFIIKSLIYINLFYLASVKVWSFVLSSVLALHDRWFGYNPLIIHSWTVGLISIFTCSTIMWHFKNPFKSCSHNIARIFVSPKQALSVMIHDNYLMKIKNFFSYTQMHSSFFFVPKIGEDSWIKELYIDFQKNHH